MRTQWAARACFADAENVTLIYQVLTRLGFKQFEININDRKLITGIGQFAGVPTEQLGGLYRSIDKLDKIGLAGVRSELAENQIPEPVIEKLLALLEVEGDAATVLNSLSEQLSDSGAAREGISELEALIGYLTTLGVPDEFYKVNVSMVRGLEYYTGPIYETVVEELKIGEHHRWRSI